MTDGPGPARRSAGHDQAMPVVTRPAEPADRRDIEELDVLARAGDVERIAAIREAATSGRCLVAEADQVIGYAVVSPRHFFARDFLELLVVDEDHRRRGAGRALLRAAVARAGTPRVFSSTNESNTAMRSLFAAEGWTLSGRLDGLDDGDPELVYFVDR